MGDLGNIITQSDNQPTEVDIRDEIISLKTDSSTSILGLAIVIHGGKDDLGKGGDTESLKTGNAGSRIACGVIESNN